MPSTASRLNFFTESVIREMTRLAEAYNAINLSQGYPDFDPPQTLLEAAERALRAGYNQYSVTWGSPRFRAALAEKQSRFMGLPLDADAHITVTCGSTEAMLASLMTVCNPGDKVIVFSPFYENYAADAILSGAEPLYVPLHPPAFDFDPDELRQAFEQGARALVLCNPSNPSGKVFRREELQLIAELAQEYDAFVITDEVYEHIVYPPHQHTYIASLPGMFARTLSCSSLSKTYAITGWRLGYVIAAAEISQGVRKVHDFLTVGAPAPLQEAAVTALRFPDAYYQQLIRAYTHRREIFLNYLHQTGLDYTIPEGAYYVLLDISPFKAADDYQFCAWMAKEIGVAAVPGSSFFREVVNHLVRLNFAKRQDTLHEVGKRLLRLKDFSAGPAQAPWDQAEA
jgi:aspartate/methionine/tyrosine aminotransferase